MAAWLHFSIFRASESVKKRRRYESLMIGRVARIMHSDGTETRCLCSGPDIEIAQQAAIEFIRRHLRPDLGDEMTIENPGMSIPRLRLTAEDVVFLRRIKVRL